MEMTSTAIQQIEDIYVLNPYSTNSGNFTLPEDIDPIYTSAARAQTVNDVRVRFSDPDRVYRAHVWAGDGTAAAVIEAAALSDNDVEVWLSKEGGGYKKDIANMVAAAGGSLALRLLVLERYTPNTEHGADSKGEYTFERIVTYSLGLGAIAVGAGIANSQDFRKGKDEAINKLKDNQLLRAFDQKGKLAQKIGNKIADLGLVRRLLLKKTDVDGESYNTHATINGKKIGGLTIANGHIMSGSMRYRGEALDQPGYTVHEVGTGSAQKIIGLLFRTIPFVGRHPMHDTKKTNTATHFTIEEPTLIQVDGEDFLLQPGTYRVREWGGTVNLRLES